MATKKPAAPAAKKTAPSASKSRAVVPWQEKLAEAARRAAAAEKPVGLNKGIGTRGGIMVIDDVPVKGNSIDAVILVVAHENQYFDGPFDPNHPQSPICYAFSDPDADDPDKAQDEMVPHAEASDKQSDSCANCELNKMGSADTGKGKACKNVRRMALVTEDALESAEDLAIAEVRTLKVPVMSGKGWANYVRNTLGEELARPYWGVVTTISLMPDPKSQFKVVFELKELIDFEEKPELFDALQKKIKETTPQLLAPYPEMEAAPPPPPARGRGRTAPAEKPVKPVGRAAQAMAAAAAKAAGNGKRAAKY